MTQELRWNPYLNKYVPLHNINDVRKAVDHFVSVYKDETLHDGYFLELIPLNIAHAAPVDFASMRAFLMPEKYTSERLNEMLKGLQGVFTALQIDSSIIIRLIDAAKQLELSSRTPQPTTTPPVSVSPSAPAPIPSPVVQPQKEEKKSNWWIWLIVAAGATYFVTQD